MTAASSASRMAARSVVVMTTIASRAAVTASRVRTITTRTAISGAVCQLYRDTVSTNFHSISLTNGLLGILLLVKGHESKTGRITSNPDVTDITELNKAVSEVLLLQTSSVANIDLGSTHSLI